MSRTFVHGYSRGIPDFERVLMKRGWTIDWLIFNAGVSEVYAFDWINVTKQFVFDTMMSFTLPQYMVERVGSVTDDGIPLVFQANTFGHYYIVLPPPSYNAYDSSNVSSPF
jgi:hypothetical protein